jgi:hypothetical protein
MKYLGQDSLSADRFEPMASRIRSNKADDSDTKLCCLKAFGNGIIRNSKVIEKTVKIEQRRKLHLGA